MTGKTVSLEVLNALKAVRDACEESLTCTSCGLHDFCRENFKNSPQTWDISGIVFRTVSYKDEQAEPAKELDRSKHSHYRDTKIQPIDVIEDWGLDFNRGNAVKYIERAGKKEGCTAERDLLQAENYIHRARTGEWME